MLSGRLAFESFDLTHLLLKDDKDAVLFYLKLNFSKLPSFSTSTADAVLFLFASIHLRLHHPLDSLVSGNPRRMEVERAQSGVGTEGPVASFTCRDFSLDCLPIQVSPKILALCWAHSWSLIQVD